MLYIVKVVFTCIVLSYFIKTNDKFLFSTLLFSFCFIFFKISIHSVLSLSAGGNEFLKNFLNDFFASKEGRRLQFGRSICPGGNQRLFVNIFVFVILLSYVKVCQIIIKVPWFQKNPLD